MGPSFNPGDFMDMRLCNLSRFWITFFLVYSLTFCLPLKHSFAATVIPAENACLNGCTLPLPCKEAVEQLPQNKLIWEPCEIVKRGHHGLDAQKVEEQKYSSYSNKGIIDKYNEQMKIFVERLYAETRPSTYCSLVTNEFIPQREVDQTHLTRSCGEYAQIEVMFSYTYTSIPLVGTVANGFASGPVAIYHNRTPLATREGAWLKSALILQTSCQKGFVNTDLAANRMIIGATSACKDSANKYIESLRLLDKYGTEHRYDVDCSAYWGKNSAANLTQDYTGSSQTALDQGEGKQTAQQICAAREYTKGMAANLAACETISRARESYLIKIGDQTVQEEIYKELDKKVSQVCVAECLAQWPPTLETALNPPTPAAVSACANTCYQREVNVKMEDILRDRAGSCT